MNIYLEELNHQRTALDAVIKAVPKRDVVNSKDANGISSTSMYANSLLVNAGDESQFIDVKMETGTGKTYVYTRLMYELNKTHGLSKFIVIVPSLAIKSGAENFMKSAYARQHFSHFFPNKQLRVYQIKAGELAKLPGKKNAPRRMSSELLGFTESMTNDKNTIHVLLISDKGYLDKASSGLFKDDYEISLTSSARTPAEALKMTRPVVIIDEPHRLKRNGKSYTNLMNEIKPQLVIRLGATFPKTGKGKKEKIDYYRETGPVHDLDGIQAFNQGLVKGVEGIVLTVPKAQQLQYTVTNVTAKDMTLKSGQVEYVINIGESLANALQNDSFDGDVTYEGGKKIDGEVVGLLSNELELRKNKKLIANTFSNDYQSSMLRTMIDEHFDKEQDNFFRQNGYPVKTLSLAFIDSIDSYRNPEGWLKQNFEELLKAKLETLIKKYRVKNDDTSLEYLDYLQATQASLANDQQKVHGGYFAKDWGEPDDSAIADERDDILQKERTLPFKKSNGEWNLRRFFFSKWTLREGWDNPNIFVIAKLRSSGSETSKLQEVGRGLRLPVDDKGNRLSNQNFYLSYIVGEDESDFVKTLAGQINAEAKENIKEGDKVADGVITKLIEAGKYGDTKLSILNYLSDEEIINDDFEVVDVDALQNLLPKVSNDKIRIRPDAKKIADKVKLNQENWSKLQNLWLQLSKRYMVQYDDLDSAEWLLLLNGILSETSMLQLQHTEQVRSRLASSEEGNQLTTKERVEQHRKSAIGQLPYGQFLEQIARQTNLPITLLHQAFVEYLPDFDVQRGFELSDYFNGQSVSNIVTAFKGRFNERFGKAYQYRALEFNASTTLWNAETESFKEAVSASLIGQNETESVFSNDEHSLYESKTVRYDSEVPELALLRQAYPDVTVFGKLPKSAIKIPTYTGGTTTPDFVYRVGDDLYLLVETKARNKRESDQRAVDTQRHFFTTVLGDQNIDYKEAHDVQDVLDALTELEQSHDED